MAKRHNIALGKGVHRTPTLGDDGELSECVNMIPRAGQLGPIRTPSVKYSYDSSEWKLEYVHKYSNYTHYIHSSLSDSTYTFFWTNGEPSGSITPANFINGISTSGLHKISSIGNTIIFQLNTGIKMAVFRGGSYTVLDGTIPEINISFGLQCYIDYHAQTNSSLTIEDRPMDTQWTQDWMQVKEGMSADITNAIVASRNARVAYLRSNGYWVFPFLVRYAIAMKDGSLIHCSAPVLMTPCTDNPLCFYTDNSVEKQPIRQVYSVAKLDMQIALQSEINALKNYSDIIDGIEIYVSEEFFTYNQNDPYEFGRFAFQHPEMQVGFNYWGGTGFGKPVGNVDGQPTIKLSGLGYETFSLVELLGFVHDTTQGSSYKIIGEFTPRTVFFRNPSKSPNTLQEEICHCPNFYLLAKYGLDELTTSRKVIQVGKDKLNNITSHKRMQDEMEVRSRIVATDGYSYNERLHLSGITTTQQNPLAVRSLINHITATDRGRQITFVSGQVAYYPGSATGESNLYIQRTKYSIDSQNVVIDNTNSPDSISKCNRAFYYLATPGSNAKTIWLYYNTQQDSIELGLSQHAFIDAAYWWGGFGVVANAASYSIPSVTDNSPHDEGSNLFLSLPGNPWIFPKALQRSVGNGKLMAMAAATKAFSPGQFGQFPLYVFSSDGIWSMEVNADGTYQSAKLISGDYCTNKNTITQTDGAVIFVTKQGLKVIEGSQVALLSEKLNGININDGTFLSAPLTGTRWSSYLVSDTDDKRTLLQSCRIVYDYADNMLHIFNSNGKHDCLALDSGEFASEIILSGSTLGQPTRTIPGYPNSLFQIGTSVYQYLGYNASESNGRLCYFITRPIAFGDFTKYKTLSDIRLYDSIVNKVTTPSTGNGSWLIVYGSNDETNWYQLNSLHGAPFKFYRIAVVACLGKDDTLSGITIEYDEKRGPKMR